MKRIIIHWTAGSYNVGKVDKRAYHYIIAGDGTVIKGNWPVSANKHLVRGKYAEHTRKLNTGSIGVSVACMHGAKESPLDLGKYPPTPQQIDALVELCAKLCTEYEISVSRETVLSHAEVQITLGVKQRGKWDITVLPWLSSRGAVMVGDYLRQRINVVNFKTQKQENVIKAPPAKIVLPVALAGGFVIVIVAKWGEILQWLGF